MKKVSNNSSRLKRQRRVRAKISGTAKQPRISIFRSLKNLYVQVIDDVNGKTLASANLAEVSGKEKNTVEGAEKLGKLIAEKCAKLKIEEAVFDRGGYKYILYE